MVIEVMLVQEAEDLDAIYKLRHRVFVDEGGYFAPRPDGRLIDRFDAYDTSVTFAAYLDGELACSLRLTSDHPSVGLPTDGYYDFRKHFQDLEVGFVASSHLCAVPGLRGQLGVLNNLWRVVYLWYRDQNLPYLFAAFNPPVKKLVQRIGFSLLEEAPVVSFGNGPKILPMVLMGNRVADTLQALAWQNHPHGIPERYCRAFFSTGEKIQLRKLAEQGDLLWDTSRARPLAEHDLASPEDRPVTIVPLSRADFEGVAAPQLLVG